LTNNDFKKLYSAEDCKFMHWANDAFEPGKSRIDEIKAYARSAGIRKIGIANCIEMQKEADMLREMLSDEFEIYSVNCKIGQIPGNEFQGKAAKGISCNPVGQADYLGQQKTELNISVRLCMGHDILFNLKSNAPVTTLIVKDRLHNHNPHKAFE